jgi:hypothetical protein
MRSYTSFSSEESFSSTETINPISAMDVILGIDRPSYINISGSSVLQQLVERDLETSDIDIYISLSHEEFNFKRVVRYINELYKLDASTCTSCSVSKLSNGLSNAIRKYIIHISANECDEDGDIVNNTEVNEGAVLDRNLYAELGDVYEEIGPRHNHDIYHIHNYLDLSSEILGVDKITINADGNDFIDIDLIYLSTDIECHLTNSYDLNVVRNYINNNNEIIQLGNDIDIKSDIALYDFKIFEKRLHTLYTYKHLFKFVERVSKYYKRGFEIYMKVPIINNPCECEDTNCPCLSTLHLDLLFLTTLHVGIVAHKYNNFTYFTNPRLAKRFNKKLITFYKDDDAYLVPNRFYEIQTLAVTTIIKKFVLMKELTEYSYRPDVLNKRLGEIFDYEEL